MLEPTTKAVAKTSPPERHPSSSDVVTFTPQPSLLKTIQDATAINVNLCYQCRKCSAGCPMSYAMDYTPAQLIHAIRLGMTEQVLHSKTMWMCASCQTCTTRCPQGLDIAAIMGFLTREALKRGFKPEAPDVDTLNQAFLREVRLWGRSYELGLMAEMKLRTGRLTEDMDLGMKLLGKNKLPFLPSPARPPKHPAPAPVTAETVAY